LQPRVQQRACRVRTDVGSKRDRAVSSCMSSPVGIGRPVIVDPAIRRGSRNPAWHRTARRGAVRPHIGVDAVMDRPAGTGRGGTPIPMPSAGVNRCFSKRGGRDRERALAAGARPRRACPVRRGATADTSRRLRRRRDLPPGPRSSHLLIRDRGAPEAHRARHRTTAHDPAAHEPAEPGRGPCASPGDRGPRDTESSVSDRPSAKRHDASPRTSGAGSRKPAPLHWEAVLPSPPPDRDSHAADPRIAAVERQLLRDVEHVDGLDSGIGSDELRGPRHRLVVDAS